ncbi:MAG: hypothetical protein AAF726_16870, partial [Planctomycetota bacterium]
PTWDGTLCIARPSYRLTAPFSLDAAGEATISIDWTGGPHATAGAGAWTPGSTWAVQALYRDPTGPGGTGLNSSSAWRVVPLP